MTALPPPSFQKNKDIASLTTIGIGGIAKYYVSVTTIDALREALFWCKENEEPFVMIGRGSNCLFQDCGFNGLIIHNKIDFCKDLGHGIFYVGAGHNFSRLGAYTARKGWSGLEFASGIPASVGGAVFMNAGANGSETCDTLLSVEYLSETGELSTFSRDSLAFKYRHSPFQLMKGAIVSATFALTASEESRQKQLSIIEYRKDTQPYHEKSSGCIFRNPDNAHAGALIEQSGLKEMQIGGAQVSDMHANFIVNKEGATAEDVQKLIAHVQARVKERTGVTLESEVRIIHNGSQHD